MEVGEADCGCGVGQPKMQLRQGPWWALTLLPCALTPSLTCSQGLMYRGMLDALLQTARTEGIFGMYKGIGASYFRLGPHTILSLFFWDQLRTLYHTYTK